jgi:hypothetical protein
LLSVGATKAALSAWRSFYDHAVIGIFLMTKDSPDLYKKFADYSHRDVKRKKDFFVKHREEMKFPAMEEVRSAAIDERTEALKELYGADFFKDYNWAKDHLSVRPTFLAIEEEAGMSRYRSFYIWASDYMHPNFNAMAKFNGDEKVILDYRTGNGKRIVYRPNAINPGNLYRFSQSLFAQIFFRSSVRYKHEVV